MNDIFYNIIIRLMLEDDVQNICNTNRKQLKLVNKRANTVVKAFQVPGYFPENEHRVFTYPDGFKYMTYYDTFSIRQVNDIIKGFIKYNFNTTIITMHRRSGKTLLLVLLARALSQKYPVCIISPSRRSQTDQMYIQKVMEINFILNLTQHDFLQNFHKRLDTFMILVDNIDHMTKEFHTMLTGTKCINIVATATKRLDVTQD